jgi:hypothetical protein
MQLVPSRHLQSSKIDVVLCIAMKFQTLPWFVAFPSTRLDVDRLIHQPLRIKGDDAAPDRTFQDPLADI